MVNCTVSEAAENSTAFIPLFRANDMRPESGVENKLCLASIKPDQTMTLSPPFYLSLVPSSSSSPNTLFICSSIIANLSSLVFILASV